MLPMDRGNIALLTNTDITQHIILKNSTSNDSCSANHEQYYNFKSPRDMQNGKSPQGIHKLANAWLAHSSTVLLTDSRSSTMMMFSPHQRSHDNTSQCNDEPINEDSSPDSSTTNQMSGGLLTWQHGRWIKYRGCITQPTSQSHQNHITRVQDTPPHCHGSHPHCPNWHQECIFSFRQYTHQYQSCGHLHTDHSPLQCHRDHVHHQCCSILLDYVMSR